MKNAKEKLTDSDLLELIKKWQDEPEKYVGLLIENVYDTLYQISKKQRVVSVNQKEMNHSIAAASSLVNEAYIRLRKPGPMTEIETVREFYSQLRDVVRLILLDRCKTTLAKKRHCDPNDNYINVLLADDGEGEPHSFNLYDIDKGLSKLAKIEPEVAEALSFRFYGAKTIQDIAKIMNKSTATIERLISSGKLMLKAVLHGVELTPNY